MDAIEAKERSKYTRMWEISDYRTFSPGESLAGRLVKHLDLVSGDLIIDFGCGPGRASKTFSDAGLQVLGIDFASNCLDSDVQIDFLDACLWDIPLHIRSDFGYCIDVMEHIPEEKVDFVLQNIRRVVGGTVIFGISTVNDNMGAYIGEVLHMTIKPLEWWIPKLKQLWPSVEYSVGDTGFLAICNL